MAAVEVRQWYGELLWFWRCNHCIMGGNAPTWRRALDAAIKHCNHHSVDLYIGSETI